MEAQRIARRPAGRGGFTLIELLTVIAVIGVLAAITLPAVQGARESARRTTCGNNLRQIGLALHAYHSKAGHFPIGCEEPSGKMIAWSTRVLPFLEQSGVHDLYHFDKSYKAAENMEAARTVLPIYLCPTTTRLDVDRIGPRTGDVNKNGALDVGEGLGCTDYGGIFGFSFISGPKKGQSKPGVFVYDKAVSLDQIFDGASNTLLVAEDTGRGARYHGEWANGQNIFDQTGRINATQVNEMWSDHSGGVNSLFCDGSVHFLYQGIDVSVVEAICTRSGHEILEPTALNK